MGTIYKVHWKAVGIKTEGTMRSDGLGPQKTWTRKNLVIHRGLHDIRWAGCLWWVYVLVSQLYLKGHLGVYQAEVLFALW